MRENQQRELIIHVPYGPHLDFEKLQYIKQELLLEAAEQVYMIGLSSAKLRLSTTNEKLQTNKLNQKLILEQLVKFFTHKKGLIIAFAADDTLDISFEDCLYSFSDETALLPHLKIANSKGDSVPLSSVFRLHRTIDHRHDQIVGPGNEPLIKLHVICADDQSESKLKLLLTRHFGSFEVIHSTTAN